jgi:putative SOS response-associated peptidase YedK
MMSPLEFYPFRRNTVVGKQGFKIMLGPREPLRHNRNMCGRFIRYTPIFETMKRFKVQQVYPYGPEPSYNIAPTQEILIVHNEGVRRLIPCRWGFIPSWAKDESIGACRINARWETVADKRSFRYAFKKRRCLVVADGFYEWKKEGGRKQPIHIRLTSGETFGFAGLYNPLDFSVRR